MEAVVELNGIVRRYGTHNAVDGVSLAIAPGERVALLGHNGAGKTTLMKLMLGLGRPHAGSVRVLGEDLAGSAATRTRRWVGFLPENIAFDGAMSGLELMRFYARLKRRPVKECDALLERVGLSTVARQRVQTYSKGMRQRLGLAQALLGDPRLLLLDEPTTGLDPYLRLSFFRLLHELSTAGTAVLLSSHALTELEERTDRLAIMKQGRLVALAPLHGLRSEAGLPVRFNLSVAATDRDLVIERLGGRAARPAGPTRLVFDCLTSEKMAGLREVAALGNLVMDVEIDPPSLDEIYAHYVGAEQ